MGKRFSHRTQAGFGGWEKKRGAGRGHSGEAAEQTLEILFFLKISFFFLCVGVLFACRSLHHACSVPDKTRRGCQSSWDWDYR